MQHHLPSNFLAVRWDMIQTERRNSDRRGEHEMKRALLAIVAATWICVGPSAAWQEPHDVSAAQGILVGEVTDRSAIVQVRLTAADKLVDGDVPGAAGIVEFLLMPANTTGQEKIVSAKAVAESDYIARVQFRDLTPGTSYVCETKIGSDPSSMKEGPQARFNTLPGASKAEPVRFVVVTGMNYAKFHGDNRIDPAEHKAKNNRELPKPYSGPDKHLGYPALATILEMKPRFFVGTGDNVYYDTPTKPRAETLEQMRRKWHEQFVQPRYHQLFTQVPTYWEIDDHDYRYDDADNTGKREPSPELGKRVMLEQLPYGIGDDVKTYRTHRISKDLQIWLTENRLYRSPNKMEDGPEKSIWGAEQKKWLKRTLQESDATFKLLISPTPMIGPDDLRKVDNHSDVGGFQHERDEFFAWLNDTGVAKHFYLVCGDRHWQYHSIHPSGIEEFSCGALVDQNSRLGRKPGDPKSTDPGATIRQPFTQSQPSGGFLLIDVSPSDNGATLTFHFYDDQGKLLYQHAKKG